MSIGGGGAPDVPTMPKYPIALIKDDERLILGENQSFHNKFPEVELFASILTWRALLLLLPS